MTITGLRNEVKEEVQAILAPDYSIDVTNTSSVPHYGDPSITFPNLDAKRQGTKLIETCVLYIDIRRSTELNFQHKKETVARLYSAFVRAMTRCARQHNGHVRGIIGDRIMVIFDTADCFKNAVNAAVSMNSVSKYVINKHFTANEVSCGIGVDYGPMLATKTGFIRHGHEQQNYRNLVWLGRPANVASKLTDIANKHAEFRPDDAIHVGRQSDNGAWEWQTEDVKPFMTYLERDYNFWNPRRWIMKDRRIAAFFATIKLVKTRPSTPPILITKPVYDGFKASEPEDPIVKNGWFRKVDVKVPGNKHDIYGGDVHWTVFTQD